MEIRSFAVGVGAIFGLTMLAGCGPSSADIQQLNQNEFALRGMIASDHQDIAGLQEQVRRLQDQLTELQHSGAASGGNRNAAMEQRLSKLESEVNALQAALPTIPAAPEATTPPPPGSPPAGGPAGAAVTPPAPPAIASPTWPRELEDELDAAKNSKQPGAKIYREGLLAMKSGNYATAIVKFAKVQHNYPKSPLSEPAGYFAANALYESGKPDQAILQFNDLVMRYPKGRFASQSLLREAQAFLKLNDRIDARLTLQKLMADHAGTPQATAAANMMKTLAAD